MPTLTKYHFEVVDENGNPITSGLRVSIFACNGAAAATVYADANATALTNPITATVFGTNLGQVKFWYGAPACDVVINDGIGRLVSIQSLTPSQNRVIFDSRLAVSGVLGNVSGTDLADASGTFIDYLNTVTLDGTLLRPGDIIKIGGWLVIDDYNSTDTLDFKVEAIDGTNDPLLLHTGDMSLVNDNDFVRFDITAKVIAVGSSGKIAWSALAFTSIAGTIALKNCTVEDGISLAGSTLDLSGNVVLTASGDYSVSHADNESQVLWDVQVIKGVP